MPDRGLAPVAGAERVPAEDPAHQFAPAVWHCHLHVLSGFLAQQGDALVRQIRDMSDD